MKNTTVEISAKSVVRTILIIVAFLVAWQIRLILISLLTAYILMSGLGLFADWFHRKGFGRLTSKLLAYSVSVIVLGLIIFSILPPLILQIRYFLTQLPSYSDRVSTIYDQFRIPGLSSNDLTQLIVTRIGSGLDNVLGFLIDTINGIFYFFTVAVLSFYLLMERDNIKNNIFLLFPTLPRKRVTDLAHKVEVQIGLWLRGQLLLMLVVGVTTYIGLTLLRVDFALPLAVIAGLLESIAIIGPIIAAIPAILIALVSSPVEALGVGVLYIFIQQAENNVLVPRIMQATAGISPLVTILALMIGGTLFGLPGALIAIPTAAIVQVLVKDFISNSRD